MNSTLKIGIALVALVGVVFGVTIIATHTPPAATSDKGKDGGADDDAPAGPALNFATTKILYAPESDELSSRFFPGVFEVSDAAIPASFWFQNPHKVPVKVNALGRSCTSCSAARVAVFPDAAVKDLQARAAAASLPISPLGPPSLLLPLAMAGLMKSAEWKDLDFDRPDQGVEVPPRAADGSPTWGVFQVGIQVRGLGVQPKDVTIGLTPGKAAQHKLLFGILLMGVQAFNLFPPAVPLGELPEGANPRTTTIYYWSGTRVPETLPPPVLAGADPNDPFLQVSPPTPMTPTECAALEQMMIAGKQTMRVTAGYKFAVTIYRRRTDRPGGPVEPDIGPLVRDIEVTGKGTGHTVKLTVAALVTGLVELTDKKDKVDLGSFPISSGAEKTLTLATVGSEQTDFTLEIAKDLTTPTFLNVTVTPAPQQAQRRFWTLNVSVPPGQGSSGDLPANSFVVLRAKTKDGAVRLIRIPVSGIGRIGR